MMWDTRHQFGRDTLYEKGDDDDIYIMMHCLFVCLCVTKIITSSWESPVTTQVGFSWF